MLQFHVVIPARHASTRLPGKPLLDIGGKPMVQHVVERACASGADEVLVATDDARIAAAVHRPARAHDADRNHDGSGVGFRHRSRCGGGTSARLD